VDYIVSFPDETPHNSIKALRPDVLVKGSNYTLDQVEGHEIVESYGGQVTQLGLLQDISTNELLAPKK
jgi:D-beta-D-heptose 7-phosphate kinase/D-beta-D-heptose 1-phosphate adenosyltransferase